MSHCKKADGDNRVQWRGRHTHLLLVYLALVRGADGKNAILKYGQPEITSTEDLLSNSISIHMYGTLKHRNQNLVDGFNLAISLRIVWSQTIVP